MDFRQCRDNISNLLIGLIIWGPRFLFPVAIFGGMVLGGFACGLVVNIAHKIDDIETDSFINFAAVFGVGLTLGLSLGCVIGANSAQVFANNKER